MWQADTASADEAEMFCLSPIMAIADSNMQPLDTHRQLQGVVAITPP